MNLGNIHKCAQEILIFHLTILYIADKIDSVLCALSEIGIRKSVSLEKVLRFAPHAAFDISN